MNAVSIDVSKGRNMVSTLRSVRKIVLKHFVIRHLSGEIHPLIGLIQSLEGESRIVILRFYNIYSIKLSFSYS